jgi:hypothetical protein
VAHRQSENEVGLYERNRKIMSRVMSFTYRILVGKPKGKRPLGRPRGRWVDNIKMDLREIGWDGVD